LTDRLAAGADDPGAPEPVAAGVVAGGALAWSSSRFAFMVSRMSSNSWFNW
jgi:hypothetical protein